MRNPEEMIGTRRSRNRLRVIRVKLSSSLDYTTNLYQSVSDCQILSLNKQDKEEHVIID